MLMMELGLASAIRTGDEQKLPGDLEIKKLVLGGIVRLEANIPYGFEVSQMTAQ